METKEEILSKVKRYITDVLEQPREEFSGFSACPFVKAERVNNKIMYEVLDGSNNFIDLVREFDESEYTTAVFVQVLPDGEVISPKEGSEYQQFLNAAMKQSGLGKYKNICFNPEQKQSIKGFSPRSKSPYFIINVAPRADLARAHAALMKTKYFDNFPDKYKEFLNVN